MRLAILMAIGSPWSAETALRLAGHGEEVHIIDFAAPVDQQGSYIGIGDVTYESNIARLRSGCAGVHFLSASHPTLRYFLSAPQLSALLTEIRADVLLTLYGGGFASLALTSGFRPYACYVVGTDVLGEQNGARMWLNRRSLASASVVFANGQYLAERARKLAPCARVVPLLLGIDTGAFAPRQKQSETIEIICSRGFLPVYNNEALIEAVALFPADVREFRVTFTSPGPQLAAARELADRLLDDSKRARVRFLGGVDRSTLIDLLQRSHIYVSVSRSDGTSTALLEALACGLFPVLSDIPQHREWLVSDNAVLSPLDDDRALAENLLEVIGNDAQRERAESVNRKLVIDRAEITQTSAQLHAHLQRLSRSSGRAA